MSDRGVFSDFRHLSSNLEPTGRDAAGAEIQKALCNRNSFSVNETLVVSVNNSLRRGTTNYISK